jgi:hypothetical protein
VVLQLRKVRPFWWSEKGEKNPVCIEFDAQGDCASNSMHKTGTVSTQILQGRITKMYKLKQHAKCHGEMLVITMTFFASTQWILPIFLLCSSNKDNFFAF